MEWPYIDIRDTNRNVLIAARSLPHPQHYVIFHRHLNRWGNVTRLKENELLLHVDDPCWYSMRAQQKIQTIEACADFMGLNYIQTIEDAHLRFMYDQRFFKSYHHLVIFESITDVLLFKLKWPGKAIAATKYQSSKSY